MSQSSLWQMHTESGHFAELCNGLYQREISKIANENFNSAQAVQVRLKSLPYYVNRTAHAMTQVIANKHSPLTLDYQNATWSAKQGQSIPTSVHVRKSEQDVHHEWYLQKGICIGLVVPVLVTEHIILDCIDRIDLDNKRIRTNVSGWFSLAIGSSNNHNSEEGRYLLKPSKRIMVSACTGHRWHGNTKQRPNIPSLRELLLSCAINWTNFKKPLAI